jgi:hypothetical protein
MSTRARRWAVLLAAAALLTLYMTSLRQGYEALLALLDLVSGTSPAALDIRPAARRSTINFEVETRRYSADLYQPTDHVLAGIVFIPGAAPAGKEDPRVINFATIFARCRFAVLVPDIIALRELKLLPETARDVADALTYLLSRQDLAPQGRAGVVTSSVGIGPALLGVLEPSLANRVRFFLSIGGYYDLPRLLTYFTTGHYQAHGVSLKAHPHEDGKWIYALSNASRLEDPREREVVSTLASRKLEDPEAPVDDLLAALGPAGRQIYAFITNTDPGRSPVLMSKLPPRVYAHVSELNLAARDLRDVDARFILVHGFEDTTIPYGESIALAQALPPHKVRLFLLHGLVHVDVDPGIMDGLKMWRAIYTLLSERYL